jgi:hypothetical protein
MSQGEVWIDHVMAPLSAFGGRWPLETSEYNRIYEAVSRGTEDQGHRLVAAIGAAIERAKTGQPFEKREGR